MAVATEFPAVVESSPSATADDADYRPSRAGIAARGLVWLLLAYVVFVFAPNTSERAAYAIDAAIFAMVGLSLNVLIGYTGQLSLGHQGFLGAGAIAAAYFQAKQSMPFFFCLLSGVLVGALFAIVLGIVALRITGLYLALITLVFGLTLQDSLFQVPALTGGGAGQPADRPSWLLDNWRFYFFCLALLAVVIYVDWRMTRSKTGRALLALKENERVAAAFGINVTAYKLLGFVISGGVGGLAGALFAYKSQQFSGADYDFFLALTFVLMTVVGGAGSRVGVILGSVLFAVLRPVLGSAHFLTDLFGTNAQFAPDVIGALLLLLTLVFNPGGIAQQVRPLTRWLSGHRFTLHGHTEAGPRAVEGSSVRA
ncbi:MAG: branched-chain amino acid ABC transporter permease [Mycobacteriales bacterium]|nr:branched-chain amino acid ABC transporter permease [Frankia sp.]